MSLYNRLFGENENAMPLLGMINTTRTQFQRYRDVFLNKEGTIITVLTRLGGGNRSDYEEVFKKMRANDYYIKDYDDDYDSTYCYFEFKVPEHYLEVCKKLAPTEDRLSIKEMFDKEVEEAQIPGSAASKRMDEIGKMIADALENDKGNIHFLGL